MKTLSSRSPKRFEPSLCSTDSRRYCISSKRVNLKKWKYSANIYISEKSTPIAVKGALIYNHYIKKMGLIKKYPLIQEGEKIKFMYLKKPNPVGGICGKIM